MDNREKQNIVILGAGFAGVRVALDLHNYLHDNDDFDIILIDRRDYQTYYSGLYEAATTEHDQVEAKIVKRTVAIPLSEVFKKTRVKFFKAYVDRIDLTNGKIVTDSRILPFDYLAIAMGSVSDFYGIPNLDKYAFTLKSLEDSIMIRNRIEDLVTKNDQGQIIIGGAGFAGTEFAGELYDLLKHECMHHNKDLNKFKIVMVEGATNFLPGLPAKVANIVSERMKDFGIETRFSSLITEVAKDSVTLNMKEKIPYDLLIWTGGVRSCQLPLDVEVSLDKKSRVEAQATLSLKNYPNVFVAGDNACVDNPITGKPVGQTAQEAIAQGKLVAKNIFRLIKQKPLLPYHASPTRFIIPVTGKYAIFYSPNLIISGFPGWIVRKAADLRYFLSVLPFGKAISYWLFENKIFMKND